MMGFSIMKVQPFPERDLVVVPLTLQPKVLEEAHSSCFGGHFSERKVYHSCS